MEPNRRILITGITGTLGTRLARYLLDKYDDIEILGISRDEQKQQAYEIKHPRLKLKMADIRSKESLYRAAVTCSWEPYECIYHLAALKCAPQLEANPSEAVATNITGTQNVIDLGRELQSRVCFTSSDKAVYPINIYGMTKAAGEKLVMQDKDNVVCRYGNVLGSRGSILPALVKSLKQYKRAHITDTRMTRFWLTIDRVAEYVAECGLGQFGGLMIPELRSSKVIDLIHATAEILEIPTFNMQDIGIRPGEKLHEHLQTEHENGRRDITSGDEDRLLSKDEIKDLIGRSVLSL